MKWIDSIGIHFLASKRNGTTSVIQDVLTFQNRITYESFLKRWSSTISNYTIFTHVVKNRRFLWSFLFFPCLHMTRREKVEDFDIANHIFCVDEAITLDEILHYCQQQSLVLLFPVIHV